MSEQIFSIYAKMRITFSLYFNHSTYTHTHTHIALALLYLVYIHFYLQWLLQLWILHCFYRMHPVRIVYIRMKFIHLYTKLKCILKCIVHSKQIYFIRMRRPWPVCVQWKENTRKLSYKTTEFNTKNRIHTFDACTQTHTNASIVFLICMWKRITDV